MTDTRTTPTNRTRTMTGPLARAGLAGFLLFGTLVVAQSALRQDRSPVRDFVSEYAVGGYGWVQTIAFLGLGSAELALGAALWLAGSGRPSVRVVAVLVGIGAAVDWTSAVFETDLDGASRTAHGQVHDIAGMVGFVSLLVAMIVLWRVGKRTPQWRRVGRLSGVASLLMAAGFVGIGAGEEGGWGGLAQRGLIAVFVAWYAVLAADLVRRTEERGRGLRDSAGSVHQ